MKLRTRRIVWQAARAALALAGLSLSPGAVRASEEVTIWCYPASKDDDGDGFAEDGATSSPEDVPEEEKLNCPGDLVDEENDCNDWNANIHPYAVEVAFNGVDENCDGRKDEPELVYFAGGNDNTKTSFDIRVRIRSYALSGAGPLYYEIEYADLASSHVLYRTPKRAVGTLPSDGTFDARLDGLQPTRVYRARVYLYKWAPPPLKLSPLTPLRTSYTLLFAPTDGDWYYSTTDGDDDTSKARTRMLLDGFNQLSASERGRVGYEGDPDRDGTRYGAAPNERWCSEFYVWLANQELWNIGWATNVEGLIDYFQAWGEYHPGHAAIPSYARRADYVPMDTDNDGSKNHSTMFLAYNPTKNLIWTLEGNSNNHVKVNSYDLDDAFGGVGHMAYEMLDWW